MQYNVMRLYADGCRLEKHLRVAGVRRGTLSIAQERMDGQAGLILVARLHNSAEIARGVPPLYNVTLAGTSSEAWVLRGFERIESGPMRRPCLLGQTWVVEPAAVQELIDAETKWGNEVRLANELREQVRLLTQAEKPNASQPVG